MTHGAWRMAHAACGLRLEADSGMPAAPASPAPHLAAAPADASLPGRAGSTPPQQVITFRRDYNRWVARETMED